MIFLGAAGHATQYLVKWKGLGCDEATWESEDDLLPKFAAELTRFQAVHPIIDEHADRKRSHFQVLIAAFGASVLVSMYLEHNAVLLASFQPSHSRILS